MPARHRRSHSRGTPAFPDHPAERSARCVCQHNQQCHTYKIPPDRQPGAQHAHRTAVSFSSSLCSCMACVKGDLLRYCCRFLPLAAIGIACSTGETSAESFDDSSPRHPHGCHPCGPALCVNHPAFPFCATFSGRFPFVQPLRQCFALPPLLVGEALAVPATSPVSGHLPSILCSLGCQTRR